VEEDKTHYSVRAVERVLKILSSFSAQRPKRNYLEIAQETQIPPSTVFKLMQLLASEGFLEQDSEAGRFEVGKELFRLGSLYLADRSLTDIAGPLLERLTEKLGLLATLAIRDENRIFALITKKSNSPIGIIKPAGSRGATMFQSAVGKALMLDMTDAEVDRIYPSLPSPGLTPKAITDTSQLKEDLRKSRERLYTIDDEASAIGLYCVGAPVRDHNGEIIAAISVTGVKVAMIDRLAEIAGEVQRTAGTISKQLGYQNPL
jgi:DNA-binding IclR family transcriptional regulator